MRGGRSPYSLEHRVLTRLQVKLPPPRFPGRWARVSASQASIMPYSSIVSIAAIAAWRLIPISGMPATPMMRSSLTTIPLSRTRSSRSSRVAWDSRCGSMGGGFTSPHRDGPRRLRATGGRLGASPAARRAAGVEQLGPPGEPLAAPRAALLAERGLTPGGESPGSCRTGIRGRTWRRSRTRRAPPGP